MDTDTAWRTADERTMLTRFLDEYRDTVVRKVEGLTDEQARTTPASIHLAGLVSHQTDPVTDNEGEVVGEVRAAEFGVPA